MIERKEFKQIRRLEFVRICNEAILEVRDEISIVNQMSGFKKYHLEEKENNYLNNVRNNIATPYVRKNGYSLFFNSNLTQYTGVARCHELTDVLCTKLIRSLYKKGVAARLRIVTSNEVDHVYLHIKIRLKHEKSASLWEIDAWDPRIVDVSPPPNNLRRRKNETYSNYGSEPRIHFACFAHEYKSLRTHNLFQFPKPAKGKAPGSSSPDIEMSDEPGLYSDNTLEEAYDFNLLPRPGGDLTPAQQASQWQLK